MYGDLQNVASVFGSTGCANRSLPGAGEPKPGAGGWELRIGVEFTLSRLFFVGVAVRDVWRVAG